MSRLDKKDKAATEPGSVNLAPCPFCDSPKEEDGSEYPPITVDRNGDYAEDADNEETELRPYAVQCCYCLAQGPTAGNASTARKFWNLRKNQGEPWCGGQSEKVAQPSTPSGERSDASTCFVPWVVVESLPEFSYMQRLCEGEYGKAPFAQPPIEYPVAFILEKDCAMWSDSMDRAASYVTFADFIAQN